MEAATGFEPAVSEKTQSDFSYLHRPPLVHRWSTAQIDLTGSSRRLHLVRYGSLGIAASSKGSTRDEGKASQPSSTNSPPSSWFFRNSASAEAVSWETRASLVRQHPLLRPRPTKLHTGCPKLCFNYAAPKDRAPCGETDKKIELMSRFALLIALLFPAGCAHAGETPLPEAFGVGTHKCSSFIESRDERDPMYLVYTGFAQGVFSFYWMREVEERGGPGKMEYDSPELTVDELMGRLSAHCGAKPDILLIGAAFKVVNEYGLAFEDAERKAWLEKQKEPAK